MRPVGRANAGVPDCPAMPLQCHAAGEIQSHTGEIGIGLGPGRPETRSFTALKPNFVSFKNGGVRIWFGTHTAF